VEIRGVTQQHPGIVAAGCLEASKWKCSSDGADFPMSANIQGIQSDLRARSSTGGCSTIFGARSHRAEHPEPAGRNEDKKVVYFVPAKGTQKNWCTRLRTQVAWTACREDAVLLGQDERERTLKKDVWGAKSEPCNIHPKNAIPYVGDGGCRDD